MKKLKLKKGKPTVVCHTQWQTMEDGSLRSGNVLIRCDTRTPHERWSIYRVESDGSLTKVHPASRPWAYSKPGQAKIGAARLLKPVEAS